MHGWVYGLKVGLLKNLEVTMDRPDAVVDVFATALKRYPRASIETDSKTAVDDDSIDDADTRFGPGAL